jgi:hypothetical protein
MIDPGDRLPRDYPLAGVQEKFWRAHSHFDTLHAQLNEYRSNQAPAATLRGEVHPQDDDVFHYVVTDAEPPPLATATIIGDIVHNLRSALDHLVFELAFLGKSGKTVSPTTIAYPCCYNRGGDNGWSSKWVQDKKLAGLMAK